MQGFRDAHHRPEDSGFVTAEEQPEKAGLVTMKTQINLAENSARD